MTITTTTIFIALALATDAVAVSITSAAADKDLNFRHFIVMAAFFGIFQAVMPLFGYFAGYSWFKYTGCAGRWISFAILAVIGGKMIYESFKTGPNTGNITCIWVLFVLAVATSIDALSVGFTMPMLSDHIFFDVTVIGIITFLLSVAGAGIGRKIGTLFGNRVEIIGGIILIIIGIKILIGSSGNI